MADQKPPQPSAPYTLILDQSAHLDWDWINTFGRNFWCYGRDDNGNAYGVQEIITQGIEYAKASSSYYYTVCEMGFLRRYIEANPDKINEIKSLGGSKKDQFQIISGGITSAENLICSAEGFIRNYLVGQHWLSQSLSIEPKPHCWLPDDFGQSPELPTLLKALGFVSLAFARLPGIYKPCFLDEPEKSFIQNGVDFMWKATDGSTIFTHWLIGGYPFGNKLKSDMDACDAVNAINDFTQAYLEGPPGPPGPFPPTGVPGSPPSYPAAPTSYMYVSIDDDFSLPISGLQQCIDDWNSNKYNHGPVDTGVFVKQGTFDELVSFALQSQNASKLRTIQYNGVNLYAGYYASRVELKILHHETVRALIGAEIFGLLTQPYNVKVKSMLPTDFWARINQTWDDFTPSTHHDYVVGTAPDAVYIGEQLPRLKSAAANACSLRTIALTALGNMLSTVSGDNPNFIVGNSLGFERTSMAEIDGIEPFGADNGWPTQPTAEGGMLLYAQVPSLGYAISTERGPRIPDTLGLSPSNQGQTVYTLKNEFLTAIISEQQGWGLVSLLDVRNGNKELLGSASNAIVFYDDSQMGNIYQFSSEYTETGSYPGTTMPVMEVTTITTGAGLGAVVLENGKLRIRIRTDVAFYLGGDNPQTSLGWRFTREYELRAGEPFLRMTTTGRAPANTSIMTSFAFTQEVVEISHGTGYHWTNVQPLANMGNPPLFRPTHDFILPQAGQNQNLPAIYQSAMPAWGIDQAGNLIGCLMRNTPCSGAHGAKGTDSVAHTQRYAIRIPLSSSEGPQTGVPFREAQSFHTPFVATRLPDGISYTGQLTTGSSASLASVVPATNGAETPAVLTVAKPGTYSPQSLVLRLYQPTNNGVSVQVNLPSTPTQAKMVTATEKEWSGSETVTISKDVLTVQMTGAIATVCVDGINLS